MPKKYRYPAIHTPATGTVTDISEVRQEEALLKTGALQNAIFNSVIFSSIATDEKASFKSSMSARNACWGIPPPTS